jgi:hypothetical protein
MRWVVLAGMDEGFRMEGGRIRDFCFVMLPAQARHENPTWTHVPTPPNRARRAGSGTGLSGAHSGAARCRHHFEGPM